MNAVGPPRRSAWPIMRGADCLAASLPSQALMHNV
jgi:hypothetical protein